MRSREPSRTAAAECVGGLSVEPSRTPDERKDNKYVTVEETKRLELVAEGVDGLAVVEESGASVAEQN
jgi:hypothetical protein